MVHQQLLRDVAATCPVPPFASAALEVARIVVRGRQRARVVRFGRGRELAVFVGGGVVMMLVVGLGAAFVSHSLAREQALEDAARMTERLSSLVVGPLVPGYLAKDPTGTAALERVVSDRMSDGSLMEVTIWSAAGEVLYSDEPQEVGTRVPASEEVKAAVAGTTTAAWEDDLPEAVTGSAADAPSSTAGGAGPGRYVEVYAPLRLTGQPPMVFEAYFDYRQMDDLARRLFRQLLTLALVPLLLLQLIQIPVGLSLGRRLRRSETERMRLLQQELTAFEQERVRFASDLHDGPIQELAGTSYAIGAVAATGGNRDDPLVGRAQDALLRSIRSLRKLMTDLDPPDLRAGRFDHTISALAERLSAEGMDVELNLAELPPLSESAMTVLYRVARETVATAQDYEASRVIMTLAPVKGIPPGEDSRIRLVVTDDGVGLDPSRFDRNSERYLRVRALHDRIESLGGALVITSAPGRGTTVQVDLPTGAAPPADPTPPAAVPE
jgi:two-component system NarL family sensor kinase